VGPSFKVIFTKKILTDPVNSAQNLLKNARTQTLSWKCCIQTYT